jgi:septal ring-binding cell division protein DamX
VLVSLGIALFNEPIHRAIFPPEDNQTASLPKLGAEVTTPTTSNQAVLSNASNPASTESAPVLAESAAPVPVDEVELSPSSTQQAAQNANVTSGSHDVSLTNDGVPNAPSTIDHQVQAVTAAVVARSQTQLAAEDARPVLKSEQVTSQSWLTQPSDHYAIQLLAMEEADANRFMRQHKLESSVTTYWVKGAEKTLLAVAVGPFAGKDEAQSEAREWQQRLPGIQPWVRSVASIQQAAQAFEQRPGEWMEQVKTDEQTLLQEPATDYAVQIMAMDRKAVTGFINEHGLADQVVYFRTRVNGREQYAALMRGFADRDQALAAGHRLATEYKGVRPWVRSLASVQQGIRLYEDHPR